MTEPGPTLPLGQKLRYGAEAALFFAFMGMFRMLGPETASGLGGWIGRNIFSLLPPDRLARANLAAAFPEMSADERNRIRRSMWDNLGRVGGRRVSAPGALRCPRARTRALPTACHRACGWTI